jgi:succinoglycan biosynthesis transport protein ExoP
MRAAAERLMTLAANPKRLGARMDLLAVLHSWGQTLTHHLPPTVQAALAGGLPPGLSDEAHRRRSAAASRGVDQRAVHNLRSQARYAKSHGRIRQQQLRIRRHRALRLGGSDHRSKEKPIVSTRAKVQRPPTIITPATPVIQRVQVAALFPVAGIMLGSGVALLREMLAGRVFLTSKSVQSGLRIACIGLLPKVHQGKRTRWRAKKAQSGADPRTLVRGDRGIGWTVVESPFSQFSEGVRSIKLAIDLENRSRSIRVVGVTSAIANEGKINRRAGGRPIDRKQWRLRCPC